MELQVDVWLRGTDFAKTHVISDVAANPAAWTDHDVSMLLKAMLLRDLRREEPELERHAGVSEGVQLDREPVRRRRGRRCD